jgi:cardiolipin synthase
MTIPNLITIARLVMVPIIIAMIVQGRFTTAFVVFVLAGLSDAADGFIARQFDMRSEFGAHLDPIADKALMVSIFVALAVVGSVPAWLAIVVVARDMMIVGAIMLSWVMNRPVRIKPRFISKLSTAAQICFAGFALAANAFGVGFDDLKDGGAVIVAALTVASAGAYLGGWLRHMAA